jgi:peptidyl-prolyl cis-trans isomerase SurA
VKRLFKHVLPVLVSAALLSFGARSADASIVERVVAVVGERPILLSDLRKRAHPFLIHIYATTQNPTQQAAQETDMFRELLDRMIDDRLEEQAADKAHLNVTTEEIDRGLKNKADSINLAVRELLSEAKRQGLTEQDYRDEIRRQVLEGKLVQLRVLSRVRVTEEDAHAAYGHWLKDMGTETLADVRILAMRIDAGSTEAQIKAREQLAQTIVLQARSGVDFCKLVKENSDDMQTKQTCGSRGPQPLSALLPALQDTVRQMKTGETADPIRYGNDAMIVVQLAKAPSVPKFEEVKAAMQERAVAEALERQRKLWLAELRRTVYVDIRL